MAAWGRDPLVGRALSVLGTDSSNKLKVIDLAHFYSFNQPVPLHARQFHGRESVCANGIVVHVHPQAFEVERASISRDVTLDSHCRRVANPVMLGAEWTADVRPISTDLLLALIHLVVVRGVGQHGVVGI